MSAAGDRIDRARNVLRQVRGTPAEPVALLHLREATERAREEHVDRCHAEDECAW